MAYIRRHIESALKRGDAGFKAILVTGARQTGKSTLLKHLYEDIPYVTFDNPVLLAETKREPGIFFLNHKPPVVLDEVQYIAELFPYIKIECDNSSDMGIIHMTGSQQFHMMRNVSESLAGRVGIFELAGLSVREINGDEFSEPFIPALDYIRNRKPVINKDHDLWEDIHRGSYPALIDGGTDWELFYSSYVQTYINRDINDMSNIKDKLKFSTFMTAMAARTGQMLNYSTVAEQSEISVATAKEWTSLLEASGIIYLLQPYSNSALRRAIKTPKVYFRDTGLVCFLTRHQTAQTACNGAMAGALYETFVVSEILKSFSNSGKDYRMHVSYYRGKDKAGADRSRESEIDLLIESDGVIYPVEIKLSANPKLDMTNAFDVIDKIPNKERGIGVIICRYPEAIWLNERTVALPTEYI